MNNPEPSPLPVTIIGGYLGSGKTTLVNHLLRHANGRRLAIMVNDFGDLPIDADLIETQDDDIISLTGGCVCCSYGNDLMMAMMDMAKMQPPPDHVVLEASGVALPDQVAGSLTLLSGFELDSVIAMVDAETVRSRANDKFMGDTITRQLAAANLVVLNKIDLVDEGTLAELKAWVGKEATSAAIVPAARAQLPIDIVLQTRPVELPVGLLNLHRHTSPYQTRMLMPEAGMTAQSAAEILLAISPAVIRAKGFVPSGSGEMELIQIVGKRCEISKAPDGVHPGVVVIGLELPNNVPRFENWKAEELGACS